MLYPSTDKHPAQVTTFPEDIHVGNWNTTKLSGAMSTFQQRKILERIEKLDKAVILAREEANNTLVEPISLGEKIFSYILGE